MSTSNLPKFLIGQRLYLRPLDRQTDLTCCWRWIHDPEVRQYIKTRVPFRREAEESWLTNPNPNDITLAIVLNNDDRHIGNIGLHRIDWIQRHAVTGTLIGEKDCWGKGYGSEAKILLLDYAFRTLNLHRISTAVLATNIRSLKCQLKCGYRQEGIQRSRIYVNGEWVDEILLGVLADEWIAQFGPQGESSQ